jgi:hypothetical protein
MLVLDHFLMMSQKASLSKKLKSFARNVCILDHRQLSPCFGKGNNSLYTVLNWSMGCEI